MEALVARDGEALVAHIRAADSRCIGDLFSRAPIDIRLAAFAEDNMVTVAQAALETAAAFDGESNAMGLSNLLVYLRAGWSGANVYIEQLGWSRAVQEATEDALDALAANPRVYDNASGIGQATWNTFLLMDGPQWRLRYLSVATDWLTRWGPARAEDPYQREAAFVAIRLILHSTNHSAFVAAAAELTVDALQTFAFGDWMIGTAAHGLVANGAFTLTSLLAFPDAPFYADARQGVRQVLDRYEPVGATDFAWFAAANGAIIHADCATVDLCERIVDLERTTLSSTHSCNDGVHIRSQDMQESQLATACADLAALEILFHRRFPTGRQPVADDFSALYEIVVFADWSNYNHHSRLFFGNATNNGGVFLQGDPSQPGNVARHLGYVATWLPDGPIWNMGHEYIHYLDGRFNIYGDFFDLRANTHKTVWWTEGLADYLTYRDNNERAVALAKASPLGLDVVFATTYRDGVERVYRWSYLAVRFLYERHRMVVEELVGYLRVGDFDGYLRHVDGLATELDAEWRGWLNEVEAIEPFELATVDDVVALLEATAAGLPRSFIASDANTVVDVPNFAHEGQALTVEAVSSDSGVVAVTVSDGTLTIRPLSAGEATLRIIVGDAWSSVVRQVDVAVTGGVSVEDDCPPWQCRPLASGWRLALFGLQQRTTK